MGGKTRDDQLETAVLEWQLLGGAAPVSILDRPGCSLSCDHLEHGCDDRTL